jgi:hypothetical protein
MNCPICNSNIEIREKNIKNKKVVLYACEKANWKTEDGEFFELTKDSSCNFKIWENSLFRYGIKKLKKSDINKILNNEECILTLKSKTKKKEYKKYAVLDYEYGVKILFDLEVEDCNI